MEMINNQKVFYIHNFAREDDEKFYPEFCVAYQFVKNGVMLAIAICTEDKYSKKEGRRIATERLKNGQSMLLSNEIITAYLPSPQFASFQLLEKGYDELEAISIVNDLINFDLYMEGIIEIKDDIQAKDINKTLLNQLITYIITEFCYSQTIKNKYLSNSKDKHLLDTLLMN